ncbi:MAG: septal ring lytic transglycosylase RlpA family protein [Arenimonas sp.]
MRWLVPALALLLAACAGTPHKPPSVAMQVGDAGRARAEALPPNAAAVAGDDPCAPTRVHRDSDYTRGGLYAPGVADGRPARAIDVSNVAEPVPGREPRAATGNRSPYTVLGKVYRVRDSADGYVERGVASWYGTKFNGRATSSGERYDICRFTAAHKTLPLPSTVRVTNLDNGRSVLVRVNDRGPFHPGRILDLSYAAAVRLGVDRTGTARVEVRAVDDGDDAPMLLAGGGGGGGYTAPATPAARAIRGKQWVQAGSFADKDNAKRLVDRLRDADVDAVDLDHVEVNDRDLWRVRIGPVDGEALATVLRKLRVLGVSNPRVTGP